METGNEEQIFRYDGQNQITIEAFNDRYIVWKEDENANWMKVSLNCYDLEKGENKRIFTYSRNKNDEMYSWNFDPIILDRTHIYFDNTEGFENGKAYKNLYDYDIEKDTLSIIAERRAADPMIYDGLSWLSYDDESGEYILQSKDSAENILLGQKYINVTASKNIIVGQTKDTALNSMNDIIYLNGIIYYIIMVKRPIPLFKVQDP